MWAELESKGAGNIVPGWEALFQRHFSIVEEKTNFSGHLPTAATPPSAA